MTTKYASGTAGSVFGRWTSDCGSGTLFAIGKDGISEEENVESEPEAKLTFRGWKIQGSEGDREAVRKREKSKSAVLEAKGVSSLEKSVGWGSNAEGLKMNVTVSKGQMTFKRAVSFKEVWS